MSAKRGTGLVIFHHPKNEGFLIRDMVPRGALAAFTPVSKRHRVKLWLNQGAKPHCTAYGTCHLIADGPVNLSSRAIMNPDDLYREIQAFDRAHGRRFPEGATTVAAMEVAKTKGWISAYHWGYTLQTFQMAIPHAPVVFGTLWFNSMMQRDAQGIVRMPSVRERNAGGHFWIASGYDARRGLTYCHNTWGPKGIPGGGFYLIPDELLLRLIRDDGEFCQVDENPLPPRRRATPTPAQLAAHDIPRKAG